MSALIQDLRYALRMLAKNPGFTVVAVLTIALGIGANTAIFSVVYGVMLKPLPYAQPDRLATIWQQAPSAGFNRLGVSQAQVVRLRDQTQAFEHVGAYTFFRTNLTRNGETERILGARVSQGVFEALRVQPVAGRFFRREEELPSAPPVVILSHALWEERFARDPGIVGRTLKINNADFDVVGVMPAGFVLPDDLVGAEIARLYLPLRLDPQNLNWGSYGLSSVARLRPGASFEQAGTDMRTIFARVAQENVRASLRDSGYAVWVKPLQQDVVRDVGRALWLLLGAVGVVLLVACANVGSLQLAQAAARQKELAVRAALGAGRSRLVRQMLTESGLLALAGGAAGLLLAAWGLDLSIRLSADQIPRLSQVTLSAPVLFVTLVLSMLAAIVFGLVPALQASRLDVNRALHEEGRGGGAGISRSRLQRALVVAETGLAFVLVIGAGLLLHSFHRILSIPPGLRIESVLTAAVDLSGPRYTGDAGVSAFYDQLLQRVRSLPGVVAAAMVNNPPLSGSGGDTVFDVQGRPTAQEQMAHGASLLQHFFYREVGPGYFETLQIPLIGGRTFTDSDRTGSPPVCIINQTMARRFWPGQSPVGHRMRLYWSPEQTGPWAEIVGVVRDTRINQLNEEAQPEGFIPIAQSRALSNFASNSAVILVRTSVEPRSLISVLRSEVRALDPLVPVFRVRTLEDSLERTIVQPRFNLMLLGMFASLALGLATVGIYGIVTNTVRQRTHEIGIRMALGAERGAVLRMILGQGMTLAALGAAAGVAAALALTPVMKTLLYEVTPTDPLTFAGVTLVLGLVSFAACYLPARRASRVDPMVALRYE